MRLTHFALGVLLAGPFFAAPASAGGSCGGSDPVSVVEHIFEMADEDADGRLSAAEYEAAHLERYGVTFVESDADGDGGTTLIEYLDLYRRIHAPSDEVAI